MRFISKITILVYVFIFLTSCSPEPEFLGNPLAIMVNNQSTQSIVAKMQFKDSDELRITNVAINESKRLILLLAPTTQCKFPTAIESVSIYSENNKLLQTVTDISKWEKGANCSWSLTIK